MDCSSNLVQNVRFAFVAEYNPVRHTSDLTYNDNKYHHEEVKDEKGNAYGLFLGPTD